MNCFVTQFGRYGVAPSTSSLNTNECGGTDHTEPALRRQNVSVAFLTQRGCIAQPRTARLPR